MAGRRGQHNVEIRSNFAATLYLIVAGWEVVTILERIVV